jgi:four helix bundle protein
MRKYRSLAVWQRAHALVLLTLRRTDAAYHPRSRALFDQVRRAVISIECNIVEGYALGTPLQFRRHLRIALGSAAEAEAMLETAGEVAYLPESVVRDAGALLDEVLAMLFGLLRKPIATKA